MAETFSAAGLTPQIWDDKFFSEYVRENRFARYMGTDMNKIIQVKRDLTVKQGNKITFAAVRRLSNAGVTGNQILEGNEEDLDSRSLAVTVDYIRHGVLVTDREAQYSAIDLRDAAKPALKVWSMERLRDDIILALGSFNGVNYATATEAQKDEWLVDNRDRALFGALVANSVSLDHSTSLATLDTTADTMRTDIVSLAKRLAKTASPHIRPIKVFEDEEWFVLLCGPRAFRDFSQSTAVQQANRDARVRGLDNPIFTGADLMWDGVIVREIPEITAIAGVGTAGADVEPAYLLGAQAVGIGWAETVKTTVDVRDYSFRKGVGIQEARGVQKLVFGTGSTDTADLKQHGMVTVYVAAAPDA